jgi:EAL domain-containing protein (putative c-di-GMP-specific phosphodiesterase class I)
MMKETSRLADSPPSTPCAGCRDGTGFTLPISMAFQPILRIGGDATPAPQAIFAYEALVRGADGAGAGTVLAQVDTGNRYAFDQTCRVKAIELAAALRLPATGAALSINFMPNAVYEPQACIRASLRAAERVGLPRECLIFEVTEQESMLDPPHLLNILASYRQMGFRTAIDDFGAGYSGLTLLAQFQPDLVKLDMALLRDIDTQPARRAIVRHVAALCAELGIEAIAEGVETEAEFRTLRELGLRLFQGYLFARPGFESLPEVRI